MFFQIKIGAISKITIHDQVYFPYGGLLECSFVGLLQIKYGQQYDIWHSLISNLIYKEFDLRLESK